MEPEKKIIDFDKELENLKKILKEPENLPTYKITITRKMRKISVEGGYRTKVSGEGADAKYETAKKYFPITVWEEDTVFSQTVNSLDLSAVVKAVNGL